MIVLPKGWLTLEEVARVAHEVNRAYCAATGDPSQPAWDEAPAWQRDSAVAGVRAHMESDLTPAQSHGLWLAHKRAEGWIYGPVKSPLRKEHPCMVPYDDLPAAQRVKDHLFSAVVRALRDPAHLARVEA